MTALRLILVILLIVGWLLVDVTAAAADPAGPTDYRSEVTEIDPETAGIEVEIIGGDSFILLSVAPGVSVEVVGYDGEPYLRYLPDGTVEENALSPTKYINEDRYGITEVPEEADRAAEPEWRRVAADGSYAWHDHRTHWMYKIRPPGKGPGDQIAEGVIPLFVDGVEVDVTVSSYWQKPPSATPVALGITVGVLLAFAAIRQRGNVTTVVIVAGAGAASMTGGAAYLSVPAETVPSWTLWAMPVVAMLLALAAQFYRAFSSGSRRVVMLVAALELAMWGVGHWDWLWPALLPTNLPFWLDRLVGAAVLVSACGAAVAVLIAAVHPERKISFHPQLP